MGRIFIAGAAIPARVAPLLSLRFVILSGQSRNQTGLSVRNGGNRNGRQVRDRRHVTGVVVPLRTERRKTDEAGQMNDGQSIIASAILSSAVPVIRMAAMRKRRRRRKASGEMANTVPATR